MRARRSPHVHVFTPAGAGQCLATREQPRWDLVDVKFEKKFRNVLALGTLKENEDRLEGLVVLQRGSRLSVQPVTAPQARELLKLAEKNDGK